MRCESKERMPRKWEDFTEEMKENLRVKAAAWRLANPEKVKAALVIWRANNRDKMRAANNRWKAANPEKAKQCYMDAAKNRDPLKVRAYEQNRYGRVKSGKLSPDIVHRLLDLQKGKCVCCGVSLAKGFHVDHIQPLSKGGVNEDWNVQLLSPACNMQKHAKDPVEFMQERGFLI